MEVKPRPSASLPAAKAPTPATPAKPAKPKNDEPVDIDMGK
jgi:hypothetical protein